MEAVKKYFEQIGKNKAKKIEEVEKAYNAFGKECFKAICENGTDNEALKASVEEIKEKISAIEAAKKELAEIKNKRVCPKCAASIEKTSIFCNYCGEKLIFEEE